MAIIKSSPEPTDLDRSLERRQETGPGDSNGTAPPEQPPRRQTGVIFVHGIGGQEPGETLLSWSAPIVRTVREWHLQRQIPIDPVDRAQIDFQGSTIPLVRLALPEAKVGDDTFPAEEWLVTEAWWAKAVAAPSALTVIRWLKSGEFGRIINGVFVGLKDNGETGPWIKAEWFLLRAFVRPLSLMLPLAYAATSLLSLIPIKPLQEGIARKQLDWFLADWLGDVRVLVTDRVQAANIRHKIAKSVAALNAAGCSQVVFVAHSGGAIASYMTLADPEYRPSPGREPSGPDDLTFKAHQLITFGQGLGLAWRVGHALEPSDDPISDERLGLGDHLIADLSACRPGLKWADFWATHDPAPAGPIGGTPQHPHEPVPSRPTNAVVVRNRMSLRHDHSGYWDNDEEFVLPVIRLIDAAEGEPSRFDSFQDSMKGWRRNRVGSMARWWSELLIVGAALILVAALTTLAGGRGIERLGATFTELTTIVTNIDAAAREYEGPADWIAGPIALIPALDIDPAGWLRVVGPQALGFVLLVGVIWFAAQVGVKAWNVWDQRARLAVRQLQPTEAGSQFELIALVTLTALVVLTAAAFVGWLRDIGTLPRLLGG